MNIANLSRLFFGTNEAGQILKKTATLTDAQIKALPTTPIELIGAPGAGYRIKIISGSLRLNNLAGVYNNVNADYFAVQIHVPLVTWVVGGSWINDSTMTFALTQGTDVFHGGVGNRLTDLIAPGFSGLDAGASSGAGEWVVNNGLVGTVDYDGTAIQISIDNNGSGVLTGGNSANTLLVNLLYTIEAV